MTAVLEAEDLGVSIGRKALIDGVTLSVAAGETVALVGPNGAGKSTLLRALSRDLAPSRGRVRLKRRDITRYGPAELAQHRAVLSQTIHVAFPFTVADVVRMGAGDRAGPAVDRLVADALAEVDLTTLADRVVTTLSGGEQSRTHFARVLVQLACGEAVHGPGVLMLDEPTASLDLRHQLDLLEATRRCAARGVAVVAILHDLNLATLFADRVIVLAHGRLAAAGRPAEVVTDAVLTRVFGVTGAVGRLPPGDVPFVLPHAAAASGERRAG